MTRPRVGIIGTGNVGTALAVGLDSAGYPVVAGWSRSTPALDRFSSLLPTAEVVARPLAVVEAADIVFLTVPDSLIPVLAQSLTWDASKTAVHCSGALSLDVLSPAAAEGAAVGSLHPLLPFASSSVELKGATAAIEGDDRALAVVQELAEALGLRPLTLAPGQKPLYHTAAALLSNYTVTLFSLAEELFAQLGQSESEARQSLLPLLQGVIANLSAARPAAALTGPISRGDASVLSSHLAALAEYSPSMIPLYRELGLKTIDLALRHGSIEETTAGELRQALAAEQLQEVPA